MVPLEQNFEKTDFYSIILVTILIINNIGSRGQNGTKIFNILDNTTELWMTKYIIGECLAPARQLCIRTPLIKLC